VPENIGRDLRTRRFWKNLARATFANIGIIAVAAGLFDVLYPDAISKLSFPIWPLVVGIGAALALWSCWPRPVEENYSSPNTTIRVIIGDLFEQEESLVIGTCDTFDTAIPHIIQSQSVQGQFLQRVYKNDIDQLDSDLTESLKSVPPLATVKKSGKTIKYPVGTVVTLRSQRQHYFLMAFTEMDEDNRAIGTIDGLWKSLLNLWGEVEKRSNGEAVAIPVLGGGQSRLSQILPAQDSIRFIILSFMFASRSSRVCGRLDIIVSEQDRKKVDLLELQEFLTSLKPS
jgi:hypothetical protein